MELNSKHIVYCCSHPHLKRAKLSRYICSVSDSIQELKLSVYLRYKFYRSVYFLSQKHESLGFGSVRCYIYISLEMLDYKALEVLSDTYPYLQVLITFDVVI